MGDYSETKALDWFRAKLNRQRLREHLLPGEDIQRPKTERPSPGAATERTADRG